MIFIKINKKLSELVNNRKESLTLEGNYGFRIFMLLCVYLYSE